MVRNGQTAIRAVDFDSPSWPDLPVEVLERSALLTGHAAPHLEAPERANFHAFVLVRRGTGTHTVDFTVVPVRPGRLIRIHPGQVQQWDLTSDYDASIVLSEPHEPPGSGWFPGHPIHCDLGRDSQLTAEALVASLRREQERSGGRTQVRPLMNALFSSLAALFDMAAKGAGDGALPEAYVAFRHAIEMDVGRSRSARDYIADLPYSERTVNRACRAITGTTAKGVLDERVMLDAKRLLVHTDASAASIAAQLGFSEATNFHKFFVRHSGRTPGEFRSARGAPRVLHSR